MTFCVSSHQKQPDNDPKSEANVANKLVTNNDKKDDATRSHDGEAAEGTESTNLGECET